MNAARWVGRVIARSMDGFTRDRGSLAASAIAFYALLALGPLLMLVTELAGIVLGDASARGALSTYLGTAVGPSAAAAVERLSSELTRLRFRGVGIAGSVVALYAGTRLLAYVQDALNQVWNVRPAEAVPLTQRAQQIFWSRARSAALIVGLGVLLIASTAVGTILQAIMTRVPDSLTTPGLWRAGQVALAFVVSSGAFLVLYRVVPDADVTWSDVWPGALVGGALFACGKLAIGWYVGSRNLWSAGDTAAALVIVLLWSSYSAHVFLYGAELSEAIAEAQGRAFGVSTSPRGSADRSCTGSCSQ